jgi:hypothetical protein
MAESKSPAKNKSCAVVNRADGMGVGVEVGSGIGVDVGTAVGTSVIVGVGLDCCNKLAGFASWQAVIETSMMTEKSLTLCFIVFL